jgi:hypothetical protein
LPITGGGVGAHGHRVKELAIDQHLRPDAVVDNVAAVFQKLPVDVL